MSIKPGEGNYWEDRGNEVLMSKFFFRLPITIQGKSLDDMIHGTVVDQIIKPFCQGKGKADTSTNSSSRSTENIEGKNEKHHRSFWPQQNG